MRIRFHSSGSSTIGSSLLAIAITNAIAPRIGRPVVSIQAAMAIQSAPSASTWPLCATSRITSGFQA